MSNYFKIYLQKESDGAPVVDTIATFGMYCMENPFLPYSGVKEVVKRSWNDEHGDDEYISPEHGLYFEAYENKIKFGFNGQAYEANKKLQAFIDYLRSGMIKMYCEFNAIGRQHVRLEKIAPTLYREVKGDVDILTIELTFKFNDPVTNLEPEKERSGIITNLKIVQE